jgi:hypothetical protein
MRVAMAVVMVVCSVVPAHTQNADLGNLWRQVTTGDLVQVKEGSGQQTTGTFAKVTESAVSVTAAGTVIEIRADDVREIRRRGDSVMSGVLLGAGIGAAVGAAVGTTCTGTPEKPCRGSLSAALAGGAVGVGVGALIDYAVKGWTVTFRAKGTSFALRPTFDVGPRGMRAAVTASMPLVY